MIVISRSWTWMQRQETIEPAQLDVCWGVAATWSPEPWPGTPSLRHRTRRRRGATRPLRPMRTCPSCSTSRLPCRKTSCSCRRGRRESASTRGEDEEDAERAKSHDRHLQGSGRRGSSAPPSNRLRPRCFGVSLQHCRRSEICRYDARRGPSSIPKHGKAGGRYRKTGGRYRKTGGRYRQAGCWYRQAGCWHRQAGCWHRQAGGRYRKALGRYRRAGGRHRRAVGRYRKAVGRYRKAGGRYRKAVGRYRRAVGRYRRAVGRHRKAGGRYRKAVGRHRRAGGRYRKAGGRYRKAGGRHRKAGGRYRQAGGRHRQAVGWHRQAVGRSRGPRGPSVEITRDPAATPPRARQSRPRSALGCR